MRIEDYLTVAYERDRLPKGKTSLEINPRLGLAGEAGYLLTVLKKEVRDDAPTVDATRSEVRDELGDMLWYTATIARRAGLDFKKEVLFQNLHRIQTQYSDKNLAPAPLLEEVLEPGGRVEKELAKGSRILDTFSDYQELAVLTSRFADDKAALIPYLVQIWSNIGDLLKPFATKDAEKDGPQLNQENDAKSLGDVMWYLAAFANLYDLNLNDVAQDNVAKIRSAFPTEHDRVPTQRFDANDTDLEQFPSVFSVEFRNQDRETAVMLINDVRVGDPLTDNSYRTSAGERQEIDIDGYRYHDSIHLAFVAILGWSPVMRSLLKRKRKRDKLIDQVEDGARAQIVEEMIVKISHSYALGHGKEDLLDNKSHVNLNLLKQINQLAHGLEVAGGRLGYEGCKYWEWEKAILQGFKIYNNLRRSRGGIVTVNIDRREVIFKKNEAHGRKT